MRAPLQWGHRLSAMEGVLWDNFTPFRRGSASMGPSPFSDGRRVREVLKLGELGAASMGPSPFSDGRLKPLSRVLGWNKLQWGHRLSAMEGT